MAQLVGAPAEVTLRRPPPLGRPLAAVRDGDALVAEAVAARVVLEPPEPVDPARAESAAARYPGFERHAFPTCFVCGPARAEGDGLRIFAGPVPGRDVFAAPWVAPDEPDETLVWAALDCPGAIAIGFPDRGETVLGRLAARVDGVPRPGERCVVVAWPLGEDGRKLYAGTALFSDAGDCLAVARATWILPR